MRIITGTAYLYAFKLVSAHWARVIMFVTQDADYLCSASYNLAVYLTAFGTSSDCTSATAANNQHLEYCSPMITFDATKNYISKILRKVLLAWGAKASTSLVLKSTSLHVSKIPIFARQSNPTLRKSAIIAHCEIWRSLSSIQNDRRNSLCPDLRPCRCPRRRRRYAPNLEPS